MDPVELGQRLNDTLSLQYRSIVQLTLAAGGLTGLEYQFVADRLSRFAAAELADTERIVAKIVALAGEPTTRVAGIRNGSDPRTTLRELVEGEEEVIAALVKAIPPTGTEGPGEAVEHLIEHILFRKHEQVDWLVRAQAT